MWTLLERLIFFPLSSFLYSSCKKVAAVSMALPGVLRDSLRMSKAFFLGLATRRKDRYWGFSRVT